MSWTGRTASAVWMDEASDIGTISSTSWGGTRTRVILNEEPQKKKINWRKRIEEEDEGQR